MEMDKSEIKIAIIGIGHMGNALYKGLKKSGFGKIMLSKSLKSNLKAFEQADWIFLAVKPNKVEDVLKNIPVQKESKLLISLAALVSLSELNQMLVGKNIQAVRIMPSLAIQIREGVIGLYTGGKRIRALKEKLALLGEVVEVRKEVDLDVLTIISGCAPAILAYFAQSFANFSSKPEALVLKSLTGSLKYISESGMTFQEVIAAVATKGGITENIIDSLEKQRVKQNIESALESGYTKLRNSSK
jgi:pyrroline-5-carboxylate reductase